MDPARPNVGVLADAGIVFVTTFLAALKAGAALVPLNPDYPDDRLRFIAEDSGIGVIATEHGCISKAFRVATAAKLAHVIVIDADSREKVPAPPPGVTLHTWSDVAGAGVVPPARRVPGGASAYVVYTSGTTGQPKGVAVTHDNLVPLLRWQQEQFRLGPATRMIQTLSPSFDFGLQEVLTSVMFGGCLLFPGRERIADPVRYAQFAADEQVTVMYLTPPHCEAVAATQIPLPALRVLLIGGQILPRHTVERISRLVPSECAIFNGYGPTEAAINCAMFRVVTGTGKATVSVPVGEPTGDSTVYVLDTRLTPVPLALPGEIAIGGPGVTPGYLHQAQITAARFVPDPFGARAGARLYLTGDIGRILENGELEILGRRDDQVKIRGFRVELGEIESTLLETGAIRESAVLLRADVATAEQLVAYVVPAHGDIDVDAVQWYLRDRLPGYMVPSVFVVLDALPLTAHGKVSRRALPKPARGPAVGGAPRTQAERQIAQFWAELLGVEEIGLDDNFFDLGGHSLLAARVQAEIRELTSRNVEIHTLFECPTVRTLAQFLSGDGDNGLSLRQSQRRLEAQGLQRRRREAIRRLRRKQQTEEEN